MERKVEKTERYSTFVAAHGRLCSPATSGLLKFSYVHAIKLSSKQKASLRDRSLFRHPISPAPPLFVFLSVALPPVVNPPLRDPIITALRVCNSPP